MRADFWAYSVKRKANAVSTNFRSFSSLFVTISSNSLFTVQRGGFKTVYFHIIYIIGMLIDSISA
jgi:hypothetical protein